VPAVVTGDVLYHTPGRRILQDVVTCIREGCTIDDAGFRRERFADRHLKAPDEMARLFARYPEALARTLEIAGRCSFSLAELRYQYPDESEVPGETPQQALERLVQESIPLRYPNGLPSDGHLVVGRQVCLQRLQLDALGVQLLLQVEPFADPAPVAGQALFGFSDTAAMLGQVGLEPVELILEARDQPERSQLTVDLDFLLVAVPVEPYVEAVVQPIRLARRLDLEPADRSQGPGALLLVALDQADTAEQRAARRLPFGAGLTADLHGEQVATGRGANRDVLLDAADPLRRAGDGTLGIDDLPADGELVVEVRGS